MPQTMPSNDLPSVAFVSLGCPKNLVDSERMLASLALGGFAPVADPDGADVAVVNTCAFIDLARAESDRHLDDLEALKAAGRLGRIVVAGCMAQRYGRHLLKRHPGVDAVVGLGDRDAMADICREALAHVAADGPRKTPPAGRGPVPSRAIIRVGPHPTRTPDDRERLRLTPRHYAYLRITEGCDNRCAYCAIPEIRGPLRSKPADRVVAEAQELVADGAKELILVGQDTTAYGRDTEDGKGSLARLVGRLRDQAGAAWIRIMYAHPASFTAEVIDQLAAGPPLVPYVDLPLQHISDAVLQSMGRQVGRAEIEDLIGRLRRSVPGIAIRTTFMVGYPGETEAQFGELLEFVEKVRFDHVGVFVYSLEAGTRAAGMPGAVPAETARRRWEQVMSATQGYAHEAARQRVGQVLEVLVDGTDETGRRVARHAGQAPEVDSVVFVARGAPKIGTLAQVRVTGARGYDLVAEVSRNRKA
ncbi:MAG: 30S ribosomal protein S12 methylthiotransferase RimO [Planctomycetes bacterium]|nr:30S ribosomal protein S12 methylthiotransferase RimO [Planctomycetota bacterium]